MPQRFVILDFLRFAFAMAVFLGHAHALFASRHAHLAVDYFFILSGFVLSYAYYRKVENKGFITSFIKDRFARLYPLHAYTLIVFVLLNFWFTDITTHPLEDRWSYQDGRAYTLLLNIGLLNNVGLSPSGPSWNAPAWSISVEFWINIAIAIAAYIFRKRVVPLLLLGSVVAYVILLRHPEGLGVFYTNLRGWLNTGLLRGIGGMGLGVACFAAYNVILGKFKSINITVLAAIALALIAAQIYIISGGYSPISTDFIIAPISALTVVVVAVFETRVNLSKFAISKVMEWLGECSYSIYLNHWAVIIFVNYFMNYAWEMKIDLKEPITFTIFVAFVVIYSRITYRLIEIPGKNFIKGKKPQKGASVAAPELDSRQAHTTNS